MQQEYLLTNHEPDLINILQNEDISSHFAVNMNFIVLYEHQPKLVVELLKEPEKCLEAWDEACINAQIALLKTLDMKCKLKSNVHCRMYHLPGLPEVCRTFFPGNEDAGKFLQVSGTVMTISPVKLLQYQRSYVCVKCKFSNLVMAEYDRKYIIKQPKKCSNPEVCPGTNFIQIGEFDSECCKDFQQIKIQEHVKKLGVGSMPNTIWVTLEDDLVDRCKPGDDVTICGIVKRRWGEFCKGCKIDIDLVLKANNIQVDSNVSSTSASTKELQEMFTTYWDKYSQDPLAGRDLILRSFCPQIFGMYLVKLAISTVLAGGCKMEDKNLTGVSTRSESHLLLVGDPGTGKSQLLRFASKITPRSVLTTGVGSTAAGLTVAAVMENGEWQLEGGALVMSDGGVCCIDEFNSMKEHDRTSIHEAMEQQTISVAKASIVCKLNTRCSILAACNPKGNLDASNPLCISTALPSPLLSRFDVTLLLRDTVNMQWDEQIADYILNSRSSCSKLTDDKLWSTDTLQSYFVIIKKIMPKLSEDAETILSRYYQMQRQINGRNKARTTVRLLESLVRLSQGHARLMFHTEVQVMDSIFALLLVDSTMDYESSILNLNITSRTTFSEHATRDYCEMLDKVLNRLNLQDILHKEVERMRINKIRTSENVQSRFFYEELDGQGTVKRANRDAKIEAGQSNANIKTNLDIFRPDLEVQKEDVSKKYNLKNEILPKTSSDGSSKLPEVFSDKNNGVGRKNDVIDNKTLYFLNEFNRNDVQCDPGSSRQSRTELNTQKYAESKQKKQAKRKNPNEKSSSSLPFSSSTLFEDLSEKYVSSLTDLDLKLFEDGKSDDGQCNPGTSKQSRPETNTQKYVKREQKKDTKGKNLNEKGSYSLPGSNLKVFEDLTEKYTSCLTDLNSKFEDVEKSDREKRKLDASENTRNFLKRFKKPFVKPDEPNSVKNLETETTKSDKKDSSETFQRVSERNEENQKDPEEDSKENKSRSKNQNKSLKSRSNDFVKDDLEMLKRMPCINDGFSVDLDFDWDSLNNF